MYFYLILIILLISSLIAVLFFAFKRVKKKILLQTLNLRLLLVQLPQTKKPIGETQSANWKNEINLSAQLFGILAGLKTPFGLEAAVHHIGEEINFYVAVPQKSIQFISRQIEGLWKNAKVEEAGDYNIFNSNGINSGVYLEQKLSYILPLKTYNEANIDTFAPILSGLSKINEIGEGAVIQVLAKPAPILTKKFILRIINSLKKGSNFEELTKNKLLGFKDLEKAFKTEIKGKEKPEKIVDEEMIKLLESKINSPLLAVNLRILASSSNQYQTDNILESISGSFSQFSAPLRQELKIAKPRKIQNLIYQFSFREFNEKQKIILNTEELSSLFHLPASSTEVPKVKWLKAKETAPSANLSIKGTLIGESVFRGETKPIYISDDDRRLHVYIIGQTGTGKSTLLTNMAIDDIKQGKGISVIDPHGDLIEKIIASIPEKRFNDVIFFDPSERQNPLGINMLEYDFNRPEEKTFIANEMQGIFNKLFLAETMGPMFEQYMRNALLLLMEAANPAVGGEPTTLMEVARVFTDVDFRQRKLEKIANPIVIDFWEKEAIKAGGEAALANITPYITSKFSNFTSNDYMRPIIGQTKSAFNFRKIMDEGKILLVNLSKGRIGDTNANLLGMVISGKILMAALSRADIPREQRRDFNLYIDEFQNFTTDSISVILSEARKYGLNLTIAHQFIAQLTDKIRDAVFGNVGSIISFRVGAKDAEFLVKQFEPIFDENDLLNIDNFNAYAKILINGQTSKPFNIKTLSPEIGNFEAGKKIKQISIEKYGQNRQKIEEEILKRLRN
ncbi:type IV secretion system DNA-binding domain-containing protein [Candidatus Wolfebacteria bacterium]|nr:type IV secretion system DNA-binding domain-containing protein [Candidatus Wolfebacteria bacterium]